MSSAASPAGSGGSVGLPSLLARVPHVPCKKNQEVLREYLHEEIERMRPSTLNARLDAVVALGRFLGPRPWRSTARRDVIQTITGHRFRKGAHRSKNPEKIPLLPLAASTKYQWKIHLQTFFKWLLQTDETPPQFRRLPFRKIDQMAERMREMVLKPKEVRQLLSGAQTARDRAIIIVALEGGFRAGEMAALRLDRMEKWKHGYWLELPSDAQGLKTGPRRVAVPIIAGARIVDDWLKGHPRKHGQSAYFFVTQSHRSYGNRMTNKTIGAAIGRCAKRAGLRHIWAHLLRHSSCSLKVAKHVNPELIRLIHGWSERSNMLGYYTHLEGHFEQMMLEVHGLEDDEPELRDIIGSQPCLLCGNTQHIGYAECSECGIPNSDAIATAQARNQREAAVAYVAIELANAMGWRPETGGMGEALAHLHQKYPGTTPIDQVEFARWCLAEWVKRCATPDHSGGKHD